MLLNFKTIVMIFAVFILLAACGGGDNSSSSVEKSPPTANTESVDNTPVFNINDNYQQLIDQAVAQGLTGISLYIETPQQSLVLTSGVANIDAATPLKPEHLFRIASNTKSFVATITLMLAEQQRINLDSPIVEYLPLAISEQIINSDIVTIKQLLSHTSGLYDYLSNPDYWAKIAESPQHDWSPVEMLSYAYQQSSLFTPGTSFDYSNSNYLILGLILDQILGYDLAIEIRQRILEPLNMTETFYYQREAISGELVDGYELENGALKSYRHINLGYQAADGGMVSTAKDLAKFFQAFGKKQYPFEQGLFEKMLAQTNAVDEAREYGLGIIKQTELGENEARSQRYSYAHGGYNNGYVTKTHYYPEEDVTISYFINRSFYNKEETDKRAMFTELIHTIKNKVFTEL